jgi:hypothetical protein
VGTTSRPPRWIKPQLTRLVDEAPAGAGWVHEIKYDGYRMHARIDGGHVKLLTRTGLDWSHQYRRTIEAPETLKVKSAYLDGELCALNGDGVPVFSRLQAAMDAGRTNFLPLRGHRLYRPTASMRVGSDGPYSSGGGFSSSSKWAFRARVRTTITDSNRRTTAIRTQVGTHPSMFPPKVGTQPNMLSLPMSYSYFTPMTAQPAGVPAVVTT